MPTTEAIRKTIEAFASVEVAFIGPQRSAAGATAQAIGAVIDCRTEGRRGGRIREITGDGGAGGRCKLMPVVGVDRPSRPAIADAWRRRRLATSTGSRK